MTFRSKIIYSFLLLGTLPTLACPQAPPKEVPEALEIEWQHKKYNIEKGTLEFSKEVKAKYGFDTLICDSLILFPDKKKGIAKGNIKLEDPKGTLFAEQIEFDWEERTGSAQEVRLELAGIHFKIKNLRVVQKEWTLQDVELNLDPRSILKIHCKELYLHPEKVTTLTDARIELLNFLKFRLTKARIWIAPSYTTLLFPSFAFARAHEPGLKIEDKVILGEHFSIRGNYGAFQNTPVTYEAEIAWSRNPISNMGGTTAPQRDLRDRFFFSYWDNVAMWSNSREDHVLTYDRKLLSLTTSRNQITEARCVNSSCINKLWDGAAETGGSFGTWGYMLQGRLQRIRERFTGPYYTRGILTGTLTSGTLDLHKKTHARLRLDGSTFLGGNYAYGWYRAQAALRTQLSSFLELGAAYSYGEAIGQPFFLFDIPAPLHSFHLRADLKLGDVRISGLAKYDLDRNQWIDHEIGVLVKAGAFEPFIAWRSLSKDILFGTRLRIGDNLRKLTTRGKSR